MTLKTSFLQPLLCALIILCCHSNLFSAAANAKDDGCKVDKGEQVSFCPCPKNCSQDGFNCSIGNSEALMRYQRGMDPLYNMVNILDPPRLLDVRYQMVVVTGCEKGLTRTRELTGSIFIQFQLPPALIKIFPEAVELYFQGIDKDDYYTKCPRQRIFQFHNYKPLKTMYEAYNPRIISYNCFYGVDSLHETNNDDSDYKSTFKKGYILALKSYPGRWINYTITINAISPMIPITQWVPTLAVSLNVTSRSLSILVEKARTEIQVLYTSAYLISQTRMIHRIEYFQNKTQECVFSNLTHGTFVVKVNISGIYNGTQRYWSAETLRIDATEIPENTYPLHYADLTMSPVKIFSVVFGCISGVALLVLLGVIVYRRRECKRIIRCNGKPMGLILHPFEKQSSPDYLEFVECYEIFLEKHCSCSLLPWKQIPSRSLTKFKTWLESDFKNLTFLLVFNLRNSSKRLGSNSVYSMVLEEAEKLRKDGQLNVIPIKLSGSCRLPAIFEQITPSWNDFETLYCKIHKILQLPPQKSEILSNQWRNTQLGQSLMENFRKLRPESNIEVQMPMEMSVVDAQNRNNQLVNNERNENNEGIGMNVLTYAGGIDKDCLEYDLGPTELDMKEFALAINKENDSVIGEMCRVREYVRETSVHSIKADVHSASREDNTIRKEPSNISPKLEGRDPDLRNSDCSNSLGATNEETIDCGLRNSDHSQGVSARPYSLSASNGSNQSDRSGYESTKTGYRNGDTSRKHLSPQSQRRDPGTYLDKAMYSQDQYRPRNVEDKPFYPAASKCIYSPQNNHGLYTEGGHLAFPDQNQHQHKSLYINHQGPFWRPQGHIPQPQPHSWQPQGHHEGQLYNPQDLDNEYCENLETHPLMSNKMEHEYHYPAREYHLHGHEDNRYPNHAANTKHYQPSYDILPDIYMLGSSIDVYRRRHRNPNCQLGHDPNYSNQNHPFMKPNHGEEIPSNRNPVYSASKRNPNNTEPNIQGFHFKAVDRSPSDIEFRSRSRTNEGHFSLAHSGNQSVDDLEYQDLKSVSEQDLTKLEFEFRPLNGGFVSPAQSSHSGGESIASTELNEQLLNINKSYLP